MIYVSLSLVSSFIRVHHGNIKYVAFTWRQISKILQAITSAVFKKSLFACVVQIYDLCFCSDCCESVKKIGRAIAKLSTEQHPCRDCILQPTFSDRLLFDVSSSAIKTQQTHSLRLIEDYRNMEFSYRRVWRRVLGSVTRGIKHITSRCETSRVCNALPAPCFSLPGLMCSQYVRAVRIHVNRFVTNNGFFTWHFGMREQKECRQQTWAPQLLPQK